MPGSRRYPWPKQGIRLSTVDNIRRHWFSSACRNESPANPIIVKALGMIQRTQPPHPRNWFSQYNFRQHWECAATGRFLVQAIAMNDAASAVAAAQCSARFAVSFSALQTRRADHSSSVNTARRRRLSIATTIRSFRPSLTVPRCSRELPKCAACKPWPGECVYPKDKPLKASKANTL
jgi:hypothetical protein